MYRIEQLENQGTENAQWVTKARYSNRNAALARISRVRRSVMEMTGNSIEGPHFMLVTGSGKNLKIIA